MQRDNEKLKSKKLDMPISTANAKLKKILLFKYVHKSGEGNCYRCGKIIESINDFSIEHKDAWLFSTNPKKLFFDTENISFSHIGCNSSAPKLYENGIAPNKGKPSPHRIISPVGQSWCGRGRHFVNRENFDLDQQAWDGLKWDCKPCRSAYRKERYKLGLRDKRG